MHEQFQRLVLLTVFLTTAQPAFASCEDELSFSLARQVSVEGTDGSEEDKDRVRIMPAGSISRGYEIHGTDEIFEIWKKPEDQVESDKPRLVSRWNALPGNVALLFEAHEITYVAWVRAFSGLPEIVIAKVDDPLQPVFHFQLSSADEHLLAGRVSVTVASDKKDTLSLQTGKTVYVIEIDQLRSRTQESGVK